MAGCLAAAPLQAAPLLGSGRDVEGVRVYRDHADTRVHYYSPGRLTLALDRSGLPQLSFLQLRYTGTAATGDRGAFRTQSNLSFRVRLETPLPDRLARVRAALRTGAGEPVLKPLPIRRVTTTLNYLPLTGPATPSAPALGTPGMPAGSGKLEETEERKPGEGYWSERIFSLAPDDQTSQLLWESFQKGRVLLSLTYSFHSDGIGPSEPLPAAGATAGTAETAGKGPHLVLTDTLVITVDAARYPDRLRRIDINESIPAHYAALSIACYDFNNALRPDLQVKVVEVEARSVTGQPLKREATFSQGTPDITTASLRFPFAVALKHGYRYRLREITRAGEETVKPWKEGGSWSQLLDVTTPPAERPTPTPPEEAEPR